MEPRIDRFRETVRKELKNELSQMFLSLLPPGFAVMKQIAMSSFPDPAAAIGQAQAIRERSVERMPELLEEFERNAAAKGAKVLWARDAREANSIILELVRSKGADYVTKGKSMVTEETGLNEHLAENGVTPFETDLGEVITQLLTLPPFHIVGPAINVPPEEISKAFLEKGIIDTPTTNPIELGKAVRVYLRERFRKLKVGIVGVNMAVAETGAVINVENEGNIRMTKSSPETLIAVMSIEKVVPSTADALHMVRILCRHCIGQKISSYVTFDAGPRKAGEIDGPRELYIVIVDNGRTRIYEDLETRQVLKCIRCGACLNTCPVYAKIGGYPYGFTYSGPMGQVINPLLLGIGKTSDLYRCCTLCGACKDICPVGIDHPSLLLAYRGREIAWEKSMPEKALAHALSFLMASGPAWSFGAKAVRLFLHHRAKDGYLSSSPFGPDAWFACRDLPMPGKTFREMWKESMHKGKEEI